MTVDIAQELHTLVRDLLPWENGPPLTQINAELDLNAETFVLRQFAAANSLITAYEKYPRDPLCELTRRAIAYRQVEGRLPVVNRDDSPFGLGAFACLSAEVLLYRSLEFDLSGRTPRKDSRQPLAALITDPRGGLLAYQKGAGIRTAYTVAAGELETKHGTYILPADAFIKLVYNEDEIAADRQARRSPYSLMPTIVPERAFFLRFSTAALGPTLQHAAALLGGEKLKGHHKPFIAEAQAHTVEQVAAQAGLLLVNQKAAAQRESRTHGAATRARRGRILHRRYC